MDQGLKNLTENILLLRKRHHLTKKEMATIMEIGLYSINKIEKGIFPPKLGINAVFCLSRHFKIPAAALFKKMR